MNERPQPSRSLSPAVTAELAAVADAALCETLRPYWELPFPATLQDAEFRLVAVNAAYLDFSGRSREALIGIDPIELQPDEDRMFNLAFRERLRENPHDATLPALLERRIVDGGGRERWCRVARRTLVGGDGRALHLCLLQDTTAEHAAREQAERSLHELDEWFELSPSGMVMYDETGLLVRSNPAFEALVGHVPVLLADAPAALQQLLAWRSGAPDLDLVPGTPPLERRTILALPDGRRQRLRALVRRLDTRSQRRHVMAVVEDRSLEDARDLAQLEIGAQLQLQAERTRAILDSVLVGIVTVGPRGIEWMNRSARRMFGGELADFVGAPIATVATPEADHPLRRTHYLHELAEGEAEAFECRLKARDGREFWVVGNAVMTGREAGGARQLTFALLDIERRRQAEVRIAQAQASLARIIETAPLAIALLDAHSLRLLQLNQMAAMFADRSIDDALGRTPAELFEAPFAAALERDLRHALDSREVVRRELERAAFGDPRLWDTRYVPLAGSGEVADQLLIVASDVTEQRAAEQARYEAAISQRDMLVKEVHHRIKNNLQGVAGLLQQIAQRRPEVAPVLSEAVGQVQAIAQVYGLQVGAAGPLRVKSVIEAIAQSVQRVLGRPIVLAVRGAAPHRWALPEAESIPIALTVTSC